MIKAVVSDMDGVIIDSQQVANQMLLEQCRAFGIHTSEREINTLQGCSGSEFWKYMIDTYNLNKTVNECEAAYDEDKEISYYKDIGPIAGIVELYQELKGYHFTFALATSASKKRMQAVLDIFGLNDLFDVVICGEDIHKSKPDPEIFLKAAFKLQVETRNCVVFEDAKNGVESAKKAGMKCVGYVNQNSGNQDLSKADLIVTDFTKLSVDEILSL